MKCTFKHNKNVFNKSNIIKLEFNMKRVNYQHLYLNLLNLSENSHFDDFGDFTV